MKFVDDDDDDHDDDLVNFPLVFKARNSKRYTLDVAAPNCIKSGEGVARGGFPGGVGPPSQSEKRKISVKRGHPEYLKCIKTVWNLTPALGPTGPALGPMGLASRPFRPRA